jgi:hypothetical protein
MNDDMQVLGGVVNQVEELNDQYGFHGFICFAAQICPCVQETVIFIWRTARNCR